METVKRGAEEEARTASDRAQVIIVGGFLLAIGVVAVTLLLNSVIFSQDIASRNDGVNERSALQFEQLARDGVAEAMKGNGTDPDGAVDYYEDSAPEYTQGLDTVSDRFASRQAGFNVSANASVGSEGILMDSPAPIDDMEPVWVIAQKGDGRFNNTGDGEWVVAGDARAGATTDTETEGPVRVALELNATGSGDWVEFEARKEDCSGGGYGHWGVRFEYDDNGVNAYVNKDFNFGGACSAPAYLSLDWSSPGVPDDIDRIEIIIANTADPDKAGRVRLINDEGAVMDTSQPNSPDLRIDSPANVEELRLDGGLDARGEFDIRVEGEGTRIADEDEPDRGVCGNAPDGEPCKHVTGDATKFVTGVIHEVENARMEYFDRTVSYETPFNVVLDKERVRTEEIPSAGPNLEIDSLNAQANNDDIDIEVTVRNTALEGSDSDTVEFEIVDSNGNTERLYNEGTDSISAGGSDSISWTESNVDDDTYTVKANLQDYDSQASDSVTINTGGGGGGNDGGNGCGKGRGNPVC